jgi:hypothetical protein
MPVFNVFNIGTGHDQYTGYNNIMTRMYQRCTDPEDCKYINDGPLKTKAIFGTGMTQKDFDSIAWLEGAVNKYPSITKLNLTGHSRGAVLCHMLVHSILNNPLFNSIQEINMFVIDPVHMSKEKGHWGAEGLDSSDRLKSYQAIIMQNENKKLWFGPEGKFYPVKPVMADDETRKKIYYIPMPGTHGSATQVYTNPVAQVVVELIMAFMSKKGTQFDGGLYRKKSPERMCELFARIHLLNPLNPKNKSKQLIFDDGDSALEHVKGRGEKYRSTEGRAALISKVNQHNFNYAKRRVHITWLHEVPYFFNQKHAMFFSKAFPALWGCVTGQRNFDDSACQNELLKLSNSHALMQTYHLLAPYIGDPRVLTIGDPRDFAATDFGAVRINPLYRGD